MEKPCIAHVHDKIRGRGRSSELALGHVTRHKAVGVACSICMASGLRSALGPSSTIDQREDDWERGSASVGLGGLQWKCGWAESSTRLSLGGLRRWGRGSSRGNLQGR